MGLTLACKDFGDECPFIARGETEDELMINGKKHMKEAHGYTDEQLNDPELEKKAKALIKQE